MEECKLGSAGSRSLDAWAMKKSWASPLLTGYEIKVSRSDFLRDEKWTEYLEACNVFYFVTPKGIIKPEELAEGIGLIEVASTGNMLLTKRKAAHRSIADPCDVFRYILIWRARITRDTSPGEENKAIYWQKWLAEREQEKHIGYEIRAHLGKRTRQVLEANQELLDKMSKYDGFIALMKDLGIDPDKLDWMVRGSLRELARSERDELSKSLHELKQNIERKYEQDKRHLDRLLEQFGKTKEEAR